MRTKSLLTVMFLFVTVLANAQVSKQATARIVEGHTKEYSSIVLTYETGESEIIPLEYWKQLEKVQVMNASIIENQKIINKLINDMAEKGYEISTMTGTTQAYYLNLFIVFTKRE